MKQHTSLTTFLLFPALAAAAQFPNATIQGCLDLGCPRQEPNNGAESDTRAWCSMGWGITDAAYVEDVIPVPGSDKKLSLGLTRTPGGRGIADDNHLSYDYEFWLVQPDGFNLTTGEEQGNNNNNNSNSSSSNNEINEVCGFFLQYASQTIPPFTGSYFLGGSNESFSTDGASNSTDCVGTVFSKACMESIDDYLQDLDVSNTTAANANTTRCEAIAYELEKEIRGSSCSVHLFEGAITVKGVSILGKDAPQASDESSAKAGDKHFCFQNQANAGKFIILDRSFVMTSTPSDVSISDYERPDVPPPELAGYLPLITLELDDQGRASSESSFICMKTLDQIYWTESISPHVAAQTFRAIVMATIVSAGLMYV